LYSNPNLFHTNGLHTWLVRRSVRGAARNACPSVPSVRGAITVELEEPEEAAQGAGHHLGCTGSTAGSVSFDEGDRVRGAQVRPVDRTVAELAAEELSGVLESIGARHLGQAAHIAEVVAIAIEHRIDRGRRRAVLAASVHRGAAAGGSGRRGHAGTWSAPGQDNGRRVDDRGGTSG
jgi:hypothetical protein